MGKKKKDESIYNYPKREKLYGRPVVKSGSARHTVPDPKPENKMRIKYENLEYKKKDPRVKIGVDFGESRFPPGAEMPQSKKYDEKGNYIKQKVVATEKKGKSTERPSYSVNQIMKENSLSNLRRKKNGKGQ